MANRIIPPNFGLPLTTQIYSQNRGRSEIAQRAIDTATIIERRRYQEALQTDGNPVLVWRFNPRGGQRCTCRTSKHIPVETPNSMEDFDENQTVIMAEDAGPGSTLVKGPRMKVNLRGQNNDGDFDNFAVTKDDVQKLRSVLDEESVIREPATSLSPSDLPDSLTQDALLTDLESIFPEVDREPCGICYGTGWIDGYTPLFGYRAVLYTENVEALTAVIIEGRPPQFRVTSANDYIQWKFWVPTSWTSVLAIRIRDQLEKADNGWTLYLVPTSGPLVPLTAAVLQAHLGTVITLQAINTNAGLDYSPTMSHIEILLLYNKMAFAQFPQFTRDISADSLEARLTLAMELDPDLGEISRETMVESPKHGRLFKVIQATNRETAKGQFWNGEYMVRIIQPRETLFHTMRIFGPTGFYDLMSNPDQDRLLRGLYSVQRLINEKKTPASSPGTGLSPWGSVDPYNRLPKQPF